MKLNKKKSYFFSFKYPPIWSTGIITLVVVLNIVYVHFQSFRIHLQNCTTTCQYIWDKKRLARMPDYLLMWSCLYLSALDPGNPLHWRHRPILSITFSVLIAEISQTQIVNWVHEFQETCHFVTLIVVVNSHQRWKQTRNRFCFHLWCELTLALWSHNIIWSISNKCNNVLLYKLFWSSFSWYFPQRGDLGLMR